jgi:hypothetical protein
MFSGTISRHLRPDWWRRPTSLRNFSPFRCVEIFLGVCVFECVEQRQRAITYRIYTHSQTPGGLAWTNFHVIAVPGMKSVNSVAKLGTNSAHTKRREQTQPKTQAEICQFIRQSKTELGGTVASVTTAITAALLTRLLLRTRALFSKTEPKFSAISFGQWFGTHGIDGIDDGPLSVSGSIFIAYEMPILNKAFMGLTESSAEAWVSGCVGYQVGGAVTIAIVFFLIVASIYFTYTSVQKKHVTFRSEEPPARFHGKWEPHKVLGSKVWWARIQDLVKEYRGECWWYKFWVMLVSALTAIFIKCISDATGNTIAILVLRFVDIIVMIYFAPHNDKWAFWQDMWVAFVNLVQAGGITYYILEKQKGDEISILFVVTTVAGISPLVLCAWRDAGSQVLEQMQQLGSPSSVFRKLNILMGRRAFQIDLSLDPNRPAHNNQSPAYMIGPSLLSPVIAQQFPRTAQRFPVHNIPLNMAQVPSTFPPVNNILFPVISQQFPRMAQRFPDQDVRANRQTVFNISLNTARDPSNFPPVNTTDSTEGAWALV